MNSHKFSLSKRLKSFSYAFNGLRILLSEEHNSLIHLVASVIAVLAGVILHISLYEWIAVCFAIGFVFAMELVNTAFENLSDLVSPQQNTSIKVVKDVAAAAVFMAALSALIVGMIVFVPKLLDLI